MKQLVDFLPVIAFVAVYAFTDIFVATAALMASAVAQVAFFKLTKRPISRQMWVVMWVALGSGGLTLAFRDALFIQWKPTIVYWVMALALVGSRYVGRGDYVERALGKAVTLPARAWAHVTWGWGVALALAGGANLFVAFGFSEAAWVTYKLVSAFAIPLLLAVATGAYLVAGGYLASEAAPEEVEG